MNDLERKLRAKQLEVGFLLLRAKNEGVNLQEIKLNARKRNKLISMAAGAGEGTGGGTSTGGAGTGIGDGDEGRRLGGKTVDHAKEFLLKILEHGAVLLRTILEAAKNQGISRAAIRRARIALRVKAISLPPEAVVPANGMSGGQGEHSRRRASHDSIPIFL
jgi:hypothetical protein